MPAYLDDHDPVAHGPFAPVCVALEERGGVRCRATDADGTYHGYRMPDGAIRGVALVTPSPAKITANDAAAAEYGVTATQFATFMARCGVLNNKAKAGTLTNAEIQESIAKLFKIAAALS